MVLLHGPLLGVSRSDDKMPGYRSNLFEKWNRINRMHFQYQRNDLLLIIHLIWFGKSNKWQNKVSDFQISY